MTEVRMSLTEAAALLGVAPNTIRSRFKANKIRGDRDNTGKLWVWIDPEREGSKRVRKTPISNPSIEPSKGFDSDALREHIQTLKEQLAGAQAELAVLRPEASQSLALQATVAALQAEMTAVRADLEHWRQIAQAAASAPRRSWWPWGR